MTVYRKTLFSSQLQEKNGPLCKSRRPLTVFSSSLKKAILISTRSSRSTTFHHISTTLKLAQIFIYISFFPSSVPLFINRCKFLQVNRAINTFLIRQDSLVVSSGYARHIYLLLCCLLQKENNRKPVAA